MRKALFLVLVGLLVAAAPVFAQDEAPAVSTTVGAALSLASTSTIDQTYFETPDNDAAFGFTPSYTLTLSASQGDLWSASAAVLENATGVNGWKASVTTSLVKVSAAKDVAQGYQLGAISDPFSFVTINDALALADKMALRLESSVFGPSLTFQFDQADNASVAAKYSLAPATVGALVKGIGKPVVVAGYGTVSLGVADVTGGFAQDRDKATENSAMGVKATVKPMEGIEVSGTFTRQAKNFALGRTSISASASTSIAPLSVTAGYSRTTKTDGGALVSDDITGSVTYDVSPIKTTVSVAYGNPEGYNQANARMKLEGSAQYALGVATVKVSALNESDKDTDFVAFTEPVKWNAAGTKEFVDGNEVAADRFKFWAQGHLKLGGSVDYNLTDAITVTPSFAYHGWSGLKYRYEVDTNTNGDFTDDTQLAKTDLAGSISQLEFAASLSYKLNSAASLSVSFSQSNYSFPAVTVNDAQGPVSTNESPVKRSGCVKLSLSF